MYQTSTYNLSYLKWGSLRMIIYYRQQGLIVCAQMLQQGFPSDSHDYDKRTGLMLASTRGHIPVVQLLLAAGAPVDQMDSFGQTALSEACKFAQDDTITVLRSAGAKSAHD